ncbi:MAG: isochorismatase family protein [Steroidobacteraceae bacterium]
MEQALVDCRELLRASRAAGIPVIHTNVVYQPGGRDGGVFFRKVPALRCFERGAHLELVPPSARDSSLPAGETVISKQYASAFFATSLASTLTSLGCDTVLIAGLSTSGCVRASAVDCCQHGFVPVVVREAVGDRAPGPYEEPSPPCRPSTPRWPRSRPSADHLRSLAAANARGTAHAPSRTDCLRDDCRSRAGQRMIDLYSSTSATSSWIAASLGDAGGGLGAPCSPAAATR